MTHRVFSCPHRVSYSECTVGNHVYHSRYLDMAERARGEFFRSIGQSFLTWQEAAGKYGLTPERRLAYSAPLMNETNLGLVLEALLLRSAAVGF